MLIVDKKQHIFWANILIETIKIIDNQCHQFGIIPNRYTIPKINFRKYMFTESDIISAKLFVEKGLLHSNIPIMYVKLSYKGFKNMPEKAMHIAKENVGERIYLEGMETLRTIFGRLDEFKCYKCRKETQDLYTFEHSDDIGNWSIDLCFKCMDKAIFYVFE